MSSPDAWLLLGRVNAKILTSTTGAVSYVSSFLPSFDGPLNRLQVVPSVASILSMFVIVMVSLDWVHKDMIRLC